MTNTVLVSACWETFATLLGQVNPGGAHVAALDLQDDSQLVVDAAVAEFSDGEVAIRLCFTPRHLCGSFKASAWKACM